MHYVQFNKYSSSIMNIIMNTCMAIATASIIFVSTAAAVSPDKRKLGKKSKSSKGNCPSTLFLSFEEYSFNTQIFVAGTPAFSAKTCTQDPVLGQICTGDKFVLNPTIIYSDAESTKSVGFYTTKSTAVILPNDSGFGLDASGAFVFDDGSEIVISGYFAGTELFTSTSGDLAITGGVGKFRGLIGEVDFAPGILEDGKIEVSFNCV